MQLRPLVSFFVLLFLGVICHHAKAQCPTNEADLADGGIFSGTCNINVGGSVSITGNVTWLSGTLTITGDNGDLNLSADFDVQGGSVGFDNNDGDVDILSGGNLIVASGASFQAADEIQVQSGGTMDVSGYVGADSYIDVDDGGSVTVNTGATMNAGTDIYVQGDLTVDGDVTADDDININNGGNVTINSGGTMSSTNDFEVQEGGSLNVYGTATSGTYFELDGGDVIVYSGGLLDATTDLLVHDNGTLDIQEGSNVTVGGNLENNNVFGGDDEGVITVNGNLTVAGNVDIADTDPDSGINGYGTINVGGTFNDEEGGDFSQCSGFPCVGPGLDILGAPASVGTTAAFNVTFEWKFNVTGFVVGDIAVGNGTAGNFVAVDANTYTADITPDGTGDITIDVGDNEVEEGNGAAYTVTVIYDTVGPQVTLVNVPPVASTTAFNLTISFDEDVTGFVIGDISVTNASTSNFVTIDAASYTVDITPSGAGDVDISIPAAAADDLVGNSSSASGTSTVLYVASFSPGDVSTNLSLWLSADQGVSFNGNTVSGWVDIAGSNDASQGTASAQPTYMEDFLNGNPGFSYDGGDYLSGSAGFYTQEYFVVTLPSEIYNSGASSGTIVGFNSGDFSRLGLGPTSGQITDEVITHSTGNGASYRGAFTSTTVDLNQPAIINPRDDDDDTPYLTEIYFNGTQSQNAQTNTGGYNIYSNADYDIGDEPGASPSYPYEGAIAEIISYTTRLSDADRRDVSSYLAIKYGITLDISSQSYTVGGTAIYDNTSYAEDIAGIGINMSSNLVQTSSKSENAGTIVRMENASDLQDGEFLVWGNNGNTNTFTTANVPPGNSEIFEKVWTVNETGGDGVGSVSVIFDITSLGIDIDNSTLNLVTMASGQTVPDNFDTNGSVNSSGSISVSNGRTIVTFENVDFADGDYFTLCGDIQVAAPGGAGLAFWLRADEGITSSGGLVSNWADQSGNANDVLQGTSSRQPTIVSNVINNNDAVYFNNDNLETITGTYTQEYFVVLQPDNTINNTTANGYVLGFETQASSGFYIGDQNIIGSDLFGQTLETDNYDVAATSASISNDNVVIFNIRNNSTPNEQELYANGTSFTPNNGGTTFANISDNSPIRLGNNFDEDNPFEGYIAEVINYSSTRTATTRRDIESYLAIKYGVTLDISSENYTSDGTAIYDNSAHSADIAGIGMHLDYGLNQISSMSVNDNAIIKMESPSDLDDQEYLVWGYDGTGSKTTPQTSELHADFEERLPAEWRVAMTGDVGTVTVKIYVGNIDNFSDLPQTASLYELIISNDDDFNTYTSSIAATTLSSDTLTFNNVDFADDDRFTLSLAAQPNVAGMTLWLKADEGIEEAASNSAEDGDNVRFWLDQSGSNNDFDQATVVNRPLYDTNVLNGNPVVAFDDGGTYLSLSSTNLNPRSVYLVYNDVSSDANTTPFTNDDNDDGNGIGYGGTTFLYDLTGTPADVRNGDNFVNGTDIGNGLTQARPTNHEVHSRVFASNLSNAAWSYYVGNDRGNTGTTIGGSIAEIMAFSTAHTATERRDIESYLAIKYGITLNISSQDYTYNSGTTIYELTGYANDIAGIGSNSVYGLSQTSSTSNSSDAIVTMSNASSLSSGDFLIWGNDGLLTTETNLETPAGIGDRMNREWGVTETGNIGTVTVAFDLTGLGDFSAKSASDFTLMLDNDTDFSADLLSSYSAQSYTSNVVTFINVDFTGATNFALGSSIDQVSDTDNDGILDYYETASGTDPNDGDDPVAGGGGQTDTNSSTGINGDGISDAMEAILISNGAASPVTTSTDSDNDGVPDYLEVANGTNPFDGDSPTASGDGDSDGDGIPDGLEALIASEGGAADPALDTDTDGDGIPDYYEVINGNDPNDINDPFADGGSDDDGNNDGDGISDGLEQILEDGGAASPLSATTDTDGDGIPDYVEAQTFSDPFNSASPISANTVLRSLQADYEASGGSCPTLSGYQWVDVEDPSGNLVFSINPFGNNLGSTCWGVRVLDGQANVRNSGDTYFINRGWYITPTTQPSTTVYVRLFVLDQETTDLTAEINADQGLSETNSSILNAMSVYKVTGGTADDLDPFSTQGGTEDHLTPTVADFSAANADVFVLGLTSFSSLDPEVESASSLPVELISFTAKELEDRVALNWQTASEINNDRFEIERSTDGVSFTKIGEMAGHGTVSSTMSYAFEDKQPIRGRSYYRLRQVDFDGRSEVFDAVSVEYNGGLNGTALVLYPNPNNGNSFTLSFNQQVMSGEAQITINTLGGQLVYQSRKMIGNESRALTFSPGIDKEGFYLVNLSLNGEVYRATMMIRK